MSNRTTDSVELTAWSTPPSPRLTICQRLEQLVRGPDGRLGRKHTVRCKIKPGNPTEFSKDCLRPPPVQPGFQRIKNTKSEEADTGIIELCYIDVPLAVKPGQVPAEPSARPDPSGDDSCCDDTFKDSDSIFDN